jgi:hypothetical protein
MGKAYEFKLLKSTPLAVFLTPTWPSQVSVTLGTLEGGISVTSPSCFPDQPYVSLGTIPIINIADPDTFTVKVVPDPEEISNHAIVILKCDPSNSIYVVTGGTFVFNGGCHSPEDPYGTIAVEGSTWGGIKELFR